MLDVVVVGGGVAGLTAAYNLTKKKKDIKVLLLEKNNRLGGLAKSFKYENMFTFDIGPKRFHTDDEDVINFIHEIGQHVALMKIDRNSKVLFFDKYYSWPITKRDLLNLPIGVALNAASELVLKNKSKLDLLKFEDYIVSKYGETLYKIFFKPYTEKFLHKPIHDIHSDWASTGINRSIINKENKGNSFFELVNQILLPAKVEANFLYPKDGGFGHFFDGLSSLLMQDVNVNIATSTFVTNIHKINNSLQLELSDGRQILCDHLLWSGKLPDLLKIIDPIKYTEANLPYIDTTFINIVFKGNNVVNKSALCQWLYISSPKTNISRISFPNQFNPGNMPDDYIGLCVEVTSPEYASNIDHDALSRSVINDLYRNKIISNGCSPCFINIHTEYSTYPVYHTSYKEAANKAFSKITDFSDKITPFGRSGSFWYNNADHSIRQALTLTDELAKGKIPYFNFRKYFGGISECAG